MHNNRKLSQYLKLWIIIGMVIVFSFYPAFAAGECDWATKDAIETIYVFVSNLWKFFSWIWLVLWNFAGVLMTNVMVYWEFIHLDSLLWKIWQMSRTIANYALWFMFMYYIFKYIFFKDDKPPIGKIKDILVASVLVQVSWFMVMVLVDLSTIVLATVSSFPSQVMSIDSKLTETFKSEMVKSEILNDKKIVVVNAFTDKYLESDNVTWFSVDKPEGSNWSVDPEKKTIDALMPSPTNLGGPFIYLWATAFKAQKYVTRPIPESANCVDSVWKVLTNFVLDAWLIILYSLALAILVVLLVMRLVFLRIFIAISPIVVLIYALDFTNLKSWKGINSDIKDILDLKKAIILIFKPAIFALWISLMFVVVVTVQRLFDQSMTSYLDSVGVSDKQQTSTKKDVIPKISSSLEDSWIVSVYLKNWAKSLKDVVLSLIALVLMRQLVKLAVTWSTWWVFNDNSKLSQRMRSLADKTWTLFWTIWVVPTPEGMMWFNEVWDSSSGYSPLLTNAQAKIEEAFKERDKSKETILALLWKPDSTVVDSVTPKMKEITITHKVWKDVPHSDFVTWLKKLRTNNKWALKFSDVKSEVSQWIKEHKDNENMYKYFGNNRTIRAKVSDAAGKTENFDIWEWWEANHSQWFGTFYKEVLLGGETPLKEYDDYKEFIDPGKGNGIIKSKTKATSESK